MDNKKTGFRSSLAGLLEAFVREKRTCGYKYERGVEILRQLDRRWATSNDAAPSLSQRWAERFFKARPGESSRGPANRASVWRELARHVRRSGLKAYIPDRHTMPLGHHSFAPFIFTRPQIGALLFAIDSLPIRRWSPRHPWAMGLLFRLLYGTGMRLGEALRLTSGDFDPQSDALIIRQGKNRRDRIIALAPSVAGRFREYCRRYPGNNDTPVFLSPLRPRALTKTAIRKTFRCALSAAELPPRVGGHGPRIHDLRHTFAVHRLENWYRAGENLEAKLPILAAYMGHARMRETHYYLRITASFFPEIARRLKAFTGDIIPQAQGVLP